MQDESGSSVGEDESFTQCVPLYECIIFRIHDRLHSGDVAFNITYDKAIMHERYNEDFSTDTISVCDCHVKSCPEKYFLFELDIFTSDKPMFASWDLVGSNETVLAGKERGFSAKRNYFYFYQQCILLASDVCLTFRYDNTYGTEYIVWWDKKLIQEGTFNPKSNPNPKVTMGNCD